MDGPYDMQSYCLLALSTLDPLIHDLMHALGGTIMAFET